MRKMEDNLRDAVLDLADTAPPLADLAAVARTRGRQIRRRRRAAFATVAVALIGVTVTPYALVNREAPAPLPAASRPPAPSPGETRSAFSADAPYRLPGGAVVTAMTGPAGDIIKSGTTHLLYDRAAGRYRPWTRVNSTVVPAPTGQLFAVYGGVDDERLRVIDAKGELKRRYAAVPVGVPQWSPDGTELLIPAENGYLISDLTRMDRLRGGDLPGCPELCSFSWLPNGEEIAVQHTGGTVDVYAADTGAKTRTLPVTGVPLGTGAWASDLGTVLVRQKGGGVGLFDVAGGTTTKLSGADGIFLPDGRIVTVDDDAVKLFAPTGRLLATTDLPDEFRDLRLTPGLP